jgi:hypothetical protein
MKRAAQLIKRLEHAVPLYVAYLVLLIRLLVALTVQLHLGPTPPPQAAALEHPASESRSSARRGMPSPQSRVTQPRPEDKFELPEAS